MKVDKFELENQRKQEILESNKYARVEIIIPQVTSKDNGVSPVVEFEVKNVNTMAMMCLVKALETTQKQILQKHPEVLLAQMIFDTKVGKAEHIKFGDIAEVED